MILFEDVAALLPPSLARVCGRGLGLVAEERRRNGLPVPAEVAQLAVAFRLRAEQAMRVQQVDGGGSASRSFVWGQEVAGRLGVSGSAVARRARDLESSGRSRKVPSLVWPYRPTWQIEEDAVQRWEIERAERVA